MNSEHIVAIKYARATLELAQDQGVADQVLRDLELAIKYFGSGEGQAVLVHPLLPIEKKEAIIESLLSKNVGTIVLSLLRLLVKKQRGLLITMITDVYRDELQASKAVERAVITTAVPLSDEQVKQLKLKLEAFSGKVIDVSQEVDKKLKAGTKIQIGDLLLDGTLEGRIEQLRKAILSEN